MAFSQPLTDSVRRKEQTVIICQLCEADQKLKWKCLECKFMMCQRCKDKIHAKIVTAEDHTIIDIKEISKHQTDSEQPDLTKLKCEDHRGHNCCLFCKTCKEIVCQICITKKHNEHKFSDINEEYKLKMEKIRDRRKNIEKELRTLTVSEQKLKNIKSNEQSNYIKVKKEILDDDKALKSEIQKHTDKLLKELDQKWKAVSKYIDTEQNKLFEQNGQIKKQIKELNTFLNPSNAKGAISVCDSLIKYNETKVSPKDNSFQGVPKFAFGDKPKIPLILGKLVSNQVSTELQLDKKFKTDLKYIGSVIINSDGSLWICSSISGVVQKVKVDGDNLRVICNFNIQALNAALLPSGDLLLSDDRFSNLKLIPSGSTDIHDSMYTVSPLYPTSVHVTCDNKVIVGAVESDDIPATGPRQIIVMDIKTGHHQKVFQYDKSNKPLFTYPQCVTSNSQGNIAVVDDFYVEDRGQVVVLNNEGKVRNKYTGHPDVNNDYNPFKPEGITTTPSDNFVVAESAKHTIHILNDEGELITYYDTKEIGILQPYSLTFSLTGQLYIGCYTYRESKDNAGIFVINNFLL